MTTDNNARQESGDYRTTGQEQQLKDVLDELRKVQASHDWDPQTENELADAVTNVIVARGRIGLHYQAADEVQQ